MQARFALDALSGLQRLELAGGAREPEVSAGPISGVGADLLLETAQLLARQKRQPNVDGGPELSAKAAGGAAGAAFSGGGSAVQHQHAAQSQSCEMPGDAGSDDAAADHDDVRALSNDRSVAPASH